MLLFTHPASSDEPSVWLADGDGSNARQLIPKAWSGQISPDGRRLTYYAGEEAPDLFVRDLRGGDARMLGGKHTWAKWSPDGKRLVFGDSRGWVLHLFDFASGESRVLVHGEITGASFAPDGRFLVYSARDTEAGHEFDGDLFVLRLEDGKTRQLTTDGHSDTPVWGNGWIAYRHFRFVNDDHWPSMGELRMIRPDGTEDKLFARGPEEPSQAAYGIEPVEFSADGSRLLACYSHEFGCPPVTFDSSGGKRHDLVIEGRFLTASDVSSDGQRVLVETGGAEGPYDVYSLPFEGGEARLLAKDADGARWADELPRTREAGS